MLSSYILLQDIYTTKEYENLDLEVIESISFIKIPYYNKDDKTVLYEALSITFNYYDSYFTRTNTKLYKYISNLSSCNVLFQKAQAYEISIVISFQK
ncbi:unnamed protein product [Paramecium pentaurelia]|uniref:Uncharacterized protein n=1 Tax=Paramecium pentaurelia TaxID=43138 RepID=A0A8S1XDK1_9CILI|nr:unnamed protein product [Paramecium pentaurelia]